MGWTLAPRSHVGRSERYLRLSLFADQGQLSYVVNETAVLDSDIRGKRTTERNPRNLEG